MKLIRFICDYWDYIFQGAIFFFCLFFACGVEGFVDLLFSLF